jgi:hypothetical protein
MTIQKTIEVTLSEPLKVSGESGNFIEEQVLFLTAPKLSGRKVVGSIRKLKQLCSRAIIQATKFNEGKGDNEQAKEDKEVKGSDFMGMIYAFCEDDVNEFFDEFVKIAAHVITIGEKKEFNTLVHWDRLSVGDQELILGEFLANFIFASDTSKKEI